MKCCSCALKSTRNLVLLFFSTSFLKSLKVSLPFSLSHIFGNWSGRERKYGNQKYINSPKGNAGNKGNNVLFRAGIISPQALHCGVDLLTPSLSGAPIAFSPLREEVFVVPGEKTEGENNQDTCMPPLAVGSCLLCGFHPQPWSPGRGRREGRTAVLRCVHPVARQQVVRGEKINIRSCLAMFS